MEDELQELLGVLTRGMTSAAVAVQQLASAVYGGSGSLTLAVGYAQRAVVALSEAIGVQGLAKSVTGAVINFGRLIQSIASFSQSTIHASGFPIDRIKDAFARLGSSMVDLGKQSVLAVGSIGMLGRALYTFSGSFGSQIGQFVELFDPGRMHLFELALKDTFASFGELLVPALKGFTSLLKGLGDALAGISDPVKNLVSAFVAFRVVAVLGLGPLASLGAALAAFMAGGKGAEALNKVMERLADVLDAVGQAVAAAIDAIAPLVTVVAKLVLSGIVLLTDSLRGLFNIITPVIEGVGKLISKLASLLGLSTEEGEETSVLGDTARGAAAGAVIGTVVPVIGTAVGAAIGGLVGGLRSLFGSSDDRDRKGKSEGKAAMPASFMSAESYAAKAYTSAYSLGYSADERKIGLLKEIRDAVTKSFEIAEKERALLEAGDPGAVGRWAGGTAAGVVSLAFARNGADPLADAMEIVTGRRR